MYKNKNGNLICVEVSEQCDGCGMCSAIQKYFCDGKDGKAIPQNGGIFPKEEIEGIMSYEDMCPEKAISHYIGSYIKEEGKPCLDDIKVYIRENLVNYKYPVPRYDNYKYYYKAKIDTCSISSRCEYKSYTAAEDAGINECRRVLFNKMDTYAKNSLLDYKYNILEPLITYEEDSCNYYYKENEKVSNLIKALLYEIKEVAGRSIKDEADFCKINIGPDFGYNGEKLDFFTHIEDYLYKRVQGDIEEPDDYRCYIEIDDFDTVETGLFGGTKDVTKYSYNAFEVIKTVKDQLTCGIKDELYDSFDEEMESGCFNELVKPIEQVIHEKGKELLKILE